MHPTWHHAAQYAVLWPHLGFYGHYGNDGKHHGMFVTGVALESIGHQIGLVPGDVILSIGATQIDSPHTYMKAIRDADGDVPIDVWNIETDQGATLTLNFDAYRPPPLEQNASLPTQRETPKE